MTTCKACAEHYGDTEPCDEGRPINSPHRAREQPRITYDKNGDARSFTGREAVDVFAMAVIASGLRLYAKTRMQPNRAYTPTAMLRAAERHTGRKFKRGQYLEAAEALSARVQSEKARIAALGERWKGAPFYEPETTPADSLANAEARAKGDA